jgi:predicted transcriptional regulator
MSSKEQITARVESDVVAVLDRIAEAERRPRSALVRNVLADYAAWQQRQQAGERVNA